MNEKTEVLIAYLKDDVQKVLALIEDNEDLLELVWNKENSSTLRDFASYWDIHLKEIEL